MLVVTSGALFQQRLDSLSGNYSEGIKGRINSYHTLRQETAMQICSIAADKGALLLRAPPSSGKTTLLQLLELVAKPAGRTSAVGGFKAVHYISLAALAPDQHGIPGTSEDAVWEQFVPDTPFDSIATSPPSSPDAQHEQSTDRRPTLLLVDEAHVAFSLDLKLWNLLKDVQAGTRPLVRMVLVSAWGSVAAEQNNTTRTPGVWGADAVIGLR